MKKRYIFKAISAAFLSMLAGVIYAQQTPMNQQIPPWMMNEINKGNSAPEPDTNQIQQQQRRAQEQQRRAQEEWQAREDAIQAKIARWRATPYYGTIITQGNSLHTVWGGGGNITPEIADKKAFSGCRETGCRVLARVSNGCMMISRPVNATSNNQWMVAYDRDPKAAINKSIAMCEEKYGRGKCGVGENPGTSDRAYCSGYDYEAYEQR